MSNKFETLDDVDAYRQLHGIDPLRMMIYQGTLQGPRMTVVQAFLRRYDEEQAAASLRQQQLTLTNTQLQQTELLRRQTVAAERQADASESGVKQAWWGARGTWWSVGIALFAIVVTVALTRCT